jgi:general stress protein 26
MPEKLHADEVNSETDPSVAKQYDHDTPKDQQWKELYEMIDGKKISIFSTYREGVGPVGRSMAIARRTGPDILYLANKHSKKFQDLDKNKEVQITFQDNKTQDWISISGTATTASSDDPRIKELYSSGISAWFGDLKDGVHDGTWKDPRMSLIEIQSKYIVYWKKEASTLGFMKEVGQAALMGSVAQTGVHREFSAEDIKKERV